MTKRNSAPTQVLLAAGTMAECALTLQRNGATSVSAFCAHCGLPRDAVRRFSRGGDRGQAAAPGSQYSLKCDGGGDYSHPQQSHHVTVTVTLCRVTVL